MNKMSEPYQLKHYDTPDNSATSYDIKLTITREDIGDILDHCLEQKISRNLEQADSLLKIAECIRTSNLSETFCQQFAAELGSVLQAIIGSATDSYEVTNFQHRMLRKFASCGPEQAKKLRTHA
jgi:hypothetical protein